MCRKAFAGVPGVLRGARNRAVPKGEIKARAAPSYTWLVCVASPAVMRSTIACRPPPMPASLSRLALSTAGRGGGEAGALMGVVEVCGPRGRRQDLRAQAAGAAGTVGRSARSLFGRRPQAARQAWTPRVSGRTRLCCDAASAETRAAWMRARATRGCWRRGAHAAARVTGCSARQTAPVAAQAQNLSIAPARLSCGMMWPLEEVLPAGAGRCSEGRSALVLFGLKWTGWYMGCVHEPLVDPDETAHARGVTRAPAARHSHATPCPPQTPGVPLA